MRNVVAIIPARGGSKGIPQKNIANLSGKPLIAWSIEQAQAARSINSTWVSSDSDEILSVARAYGAVPLKRPEELSGDNVPSESAWLHALEVIERTHGNVDLVVGMQATSPIREPADLDRAIALFKEERLDSLLSCCEIQDFFIWRPGGDGHPEGVNHDYRHRQRRQAIGKQYLENGSFYLFTPHLLRSTNTRLGGRIGMYVMEKHKMFQIDTPEDLVLCRVIMQAYGLA